MKKVLILLIILSASYQTIQAKTKLDSVNVAAISGTDTIIEISRNFVFWGNSWTIEFEYSDLNANDATIDLGTRLGINANGLTDSTFNSMNGINGLALPFTLDATSNADSYYGKSSFMVVYKQFDASKLLLKINPGSVSSGYIRYKIVWR